MLSEGIGYDGGGLEQIGSSVDIVDISRVRNLLLTFIPGMRKKREENKMATIQVNALLKQIAEERKGEGRDDLSREVTIPLFSYSLPC